MSHFSFLQIVEKKYLKLKIGRELTDVTNRRSFPGIFFSLGGIPCRRRADGIRWIQEKGDNVQRIQEEDDGVQWIQGEGVLKKYYTG